MPFKIKGKKFISASILSLIFGAVLLLMFSALLPSGLYGDDNLQNNADMQDPGNVKEINKYIICKIEGIINPVISNYIEKSLAEAQKEQAALIMLIDTPGGLETSMREIALNMISTPIPVITLVYPEGARAASAGVFIVYASDIASMSPNASIGAAHPVTLGSDQGVTEEQMDKIVNDSVSFIKNLANLNGRNAVWAEEAIRQSVSITSAQALELNVINNISSDTDELIKKIDGAIIKKQGNAFELSGTNYTSRTLEMGFVSRFLHVLINPNIAYILFTLGLLGIIYEFSQPGLGISGALGVIFIILGFYSFSILPTNYAGLALIIAAIILFVLDLKLALGGILSIAGVASMIIGSFILIDTAAPYLQIARGLIIGISVSISAFLIIVIRAVYKAHRNKPVTGTAGMIKTTGVAIEDLNPAGMIKTHGEIWKAESFDGKVIKKDSVVDIVSIEGMLLKVKQADNGNL
ncbi:MAG: nodulation protein NfeD [Actinobacteria bacterium]|nr:nodulation protein NfeD [Actinomycetota bacterium]